MDIHQGQPLFRGDKQTDKKKKTKRKRQTDKKKKTDRQKEKRLTDRQTKGKKKDRQKEKKTLNIFYKIHFSVPMIFDRGTQGIAFVVV